MLRRTMSVKRDTQRKDDATLVRHIYDVYCILKTEAQLENFDLTAMTALFNTVLKEDIDRFGNQHTEFVANPKQELQLGLKELEDNPVFASAFRTLLPLWCLTPSLMILIPALPRLNALRSR